MHSWPSYNYFLKSQVPRHFGQSSAKSSFSEVARVWFLFYTILNLILFHLQSDLDDEREVSYQDGKKIAATLCCSFFETSAKNDIGVDEVFTNLTKKMRESRANSVRKAFIRDRHRFSLRNLSLKEKKCKEKLQAFRAGETKSKLSKRANGRFRGLICGARSLDTIDG